MELKENLKKWKVVLASASPRRKELLAQIGIIPDIRPSEVEEEKNEKDPAKLVENLSYIKAADVASRCEKGTLVIGADTVVACDQEILGKPADDQDAFRMLHMLQGRTHEVYTGVTIVEGSLDSGKTTVFAEKTEVTMYPMSDQMIWDYIRTGEPSDKAGAYGIQGRAAVFIKSIKGDYNNVVGLPVAAVWQYLNADKEEKHAAL